MTPTPDRILTAPGTETGLVARTATQLFNAALGTALCTGPVTSVLALGWLMRRSGHRARVRFGAAEETPGWLLGPREVGGRPSGRTTRLLGGLAGNVRTGLIGFAALLAWTLPFTLLWLGSWWAGWENSFNKGYEQAFVGPFVFLLGAALGALLIPALPFMISHVATEDRLSAAFELRRIRSLIAQAGWRVPGVTLIVAATAAVLFAARGAMTTAGDWAPWIEDLSPEAAAELVARITLALAAFVFLSSWLVRRLATAAYITAAPRAAGLKPGLWDGSQAAEAAGPASRASRVMTVLWYGAAVAISLGLGFAILAGQFLVHAWWRWLLHPALTLPWAG